MLEHFNSLIYIQALITRQKISVKEVHHYKCCIVEGGEEPQCGRISNPYIYNDGKC